MKLSRRKKKKLQIAAGTIIVILIVVLIVINQAQHEVNISGQVEELSVWPARELPTEYPDIHFEDVTLQSGINFRHFYGERGSRLAEDMGSGVAWIDYNNNGLQDLFIVNYAGPLDMTGDELNESPATTALYRNNGNGTFTDVSKEAGLKLHIRGMATAWADYNNSGWIDCLITAYGQNRLFRNNGDGTFTEVTEEAGLGGREGYWAGAAWGDYNRNGYVDIYITGYVDYYDLPDMSRYVDLQEPPSIHPASFEPVSGLLYRNNGDGTFTEIAEEVGVGNPNGRSLDAMWVDLTDNGWPDLYIANDISDNRFYRNMGDGTFMDISYPTGTADSRGSMGMAVGDWNGNEMLDFFITHWAAEENALYKNISSEGMIYFRDDSENYGLGQSLMPLVGWATSFLDIDNDGRLDLYVVNGHTDQQQVRPTQLMPQADQIYWNRNNVEGFYDLSSIAGGYFREQHVGRGGAYADFNNNGRLDLFIVNHSGPGVLLENRTETGYNWLQVHLTGTESNRSAIGAKLRLVTADGVQIRQVGSQASYLSQNSLVQHFGLKHSEVVDSLEIVWPSGIRQVLKGIPVNRRLEVLESEKGTRNF